MNFTALDFETANGSRASVCSVGLVRFENGIEVKRVHQLINPRAPFNFYNTAIHGITAFDVRDAPDFGEFFDEIRPLLSDNVVAHNAPFDISCLRAETERYALPVDDFKYFCTLAMSRRIAAGLSCHKLDAVAEFYGLGDFNHHNALADAEICGKIFELLAPRADLQTFTKKFFDARHKTQKKSATTSRHLFGKFGSSGSPFIPRPQNAPVYKFRRFIEHPPLGCSTRDAYQSAEERERKRDAIPQNELVFDYSPVDFARNFVVTGEFGEGGAKYIESLILMREGKVQRRVDATTDYVVVGERPSASWGAGEYGREIDDALAIGRAAFITQKHLISQMV